MPLEYAQELCEHWRTRYDWRRCEAELNSWPQFRTGLDGGADDSVDVHFIHARSPHKKALPLVLSHGSPCSVIEYLDVLDELVNPPDSGPRVPRGHCPRCPASGSAANPGSPAGRSGSRWPGHS